MATALQILEERRDKHSVQVLQHKFRRLAPKMPLRKLEQQAEGVPIRRYRMRAGFPLRHEPLGKEGFQERRELGGDFHAIPSHRFSSKRPAVSMSSGVQLKYQ
jgi:hypothetical protein